MKKQILLLIMTLLPMMASADVTIDEVNFPDDNFRSFLLGQTYGTDNVLTDAEIATITSINVNDKSISNLKGIEYFTALTTLYCLRNQLTVLDLSNNTALETLQCGNNQLIELDVSKNTALSYLWCSNNQLTELDVSMNTALTSLFCHYNELTSLNVSGCTKLTRIYCHNNLLTGEAIDAFIATLPSIGGNLFIIYDEDEGNEMTLDQVLAARSKGWMPKYMNGSQWQDFNGGITISKANFPDANFRSFLHEQDYGKDGVITATEIANVDIISVTSRSITDLKGIEFFSKLRRLDCSFNQLTTLDVSKNSNLRTLSCTNNLLTELEVNADLYELACGNNHLTDVSKFTGVAKLSCPNNHMTELDVSELKNLKELYIYCNQITGEAMDALIASLPPLPSYFRLYVIYNENEGNEMTVEQVAEATARGWIPMYYDGEQWNEYAGKVEYIEISEANFPDANFRKFLLNQEYGNDGFLTNFEIPQIYEMNVSQQNIASLKGIEYFTALTSLYCAHNKLTSLNVSGCTELTRISCHTNQINGIEMNAFVASLPSTKNGILAIYNRRDNGTAADGENNYMTTTHVAIVEEKGWTPYNVCNGFFNGWFKGFPELYLKGDAHVDGQVNVTDIVAMVNYIMNKPSPRFAPEAADINMDGIVNVTDIVATVNIIMKGDN